MGGSITALAELFLVCEALMGESNRCSPFRQQNLHALASFDVTLMPLQEEKSAWCYSFCFWSTDHDSI